MIRFLKALILLPIAILVVLLAVANRAPVTLSLDPFSQDAPEFAKFFEADSARLIPVLKKIGKVEGG